MYVDRPSQRDVRVVQHYCITCVYLSYYLQCVQFHQSKVNVRDLAMLSQKIWPLFELTLSFQWVKDFLSKLLPRLWMTRLFRIFKLYCLFEFFSFSY